MNERDAVFAPGARRWPFRAVRQKHGLGLSTSACRVVTRRLGKQASVLVEARSTGVAFPHAWRNIAPGVENACIAAARMAVVIDNWCA
ncbi:MAG TPA: hypothetical protein VF458_01640 [Ktedonobacteraceae bacterium]